MEEVIDSQLVLQNNKESWSTENHSMRQIFKKEIMLKITNKMMWKKD